MDFSDNITKIALAIITIFAVGIAIKIIIKKKYKKTDNSTNLKNVNAGRDIVFGDKKTNIRK